MNICGVLVQTDPARTSSVAAVLATLDGVEVHQTGEGGRIVVTVEDTAQAVAIDSLRTIQRLDGVVAASLVYHHFDPESQFALHRGIT